MSCIYKINFPISLEPWDCYLQTSCLSIHKNGHLPCDFPQLVGINQDIFERLFEFYSESLSSGYHLLINLSISLHQMTWPSVGPMHSIWSLVISVNMAAPSPIILELGETTLCSKGSFVIEVLSL